ncbi:unnamed protein product [Haemonchus placei]|uniref:Uncharacterized protein n=1 Tax=Haemonchus placei TaxID=6290 RepID=A0A3P7YRL2_HAEPC|nr:unnamed protein product [Haemonchus placei]
MLRMGQLLALPVVSSFRYKLNIADMEMLKYLLQKLKTIVKPGIAGSMELARSLLTGSDVGDVLEFEVGAEIFTYFTIRGEH